MTLVVISIESDRPKERDGGISRLEHAQRKLSASEFCLGLVLFCSFQKSRRRSVYVPTYPDEVVVEVVVVDDDVAIRKKSGTTTKN